MASCRLLRQTFRHVQKHVCKVGAAKSSLRWLSLSQKLFNERRFTADHEWIDVSGNIGTIGITEYAQNKLGEIVYVELPEVGATLEAEEVAGALESVKAAADIMNPCPGKVTEINEVLTESPSLVNKAPFTDGWLYKLELSDPAQVKDLMDEDRYKSFTESTDY